MATAGTEAKAEAAAAECYCKKWDLQHDRSLDPPLLPDAEIFPPAPDPPSTDGPQSQLDINRLAVAGKQHFRARLVLLDDLFRDWTWMHAMRSSPRFSDPTSPLAAMKPRPHTAGRQAIEGWIAFGDDIAELPVRFLADRVAGPKVSRSGGNDDDNDNSGDENVDDYVRAMRIIATTSDAVGKLLPVKSDSHEALLYMRSIDHVTVEERVEIAARGEEDLVVEIGGIEYSYMRGHDNVADAVRVCQWAMCELRTVEPGVMRYLDSISVSGPLGRKSGGTGA